MWKTQVEKQRRESTTKEKPKKEEETPAPAPAETKPAPAKPVNIDFEVLNDKTRNACLKLLYASLELAPGTDAQNVYCCALRIEQSTLDTIGQGSVNGDYRAKIRSLSLNLKDKNNPELREQVLDGSISADELVVMKSEVRLPTHPRTWRPAHARPSAKSSSSKTCTTPRAPRPRRPRPTRSSAESASSARRVTTRCRHGAPMSLCTSIH